MKKIFLIFLFFVQSYMVHAGEISQISEIKRVFGIWMLKMNDKTIWAITNRSQIPWTKDDLVEITRDYDPVTTDQRATHRIATIGEGSFAYASIVSSLRVEKIRIDEIIFGEDSSINFYVDGRMWQVSKKETHNMTHWAVGDFISLYKIDRNCYVFRNESKHENHTMVVRRV